MDGWLVVERRGVWHDRRDARARPRTAHGQEDQEVAFWYAGCPWPIEIERSIEMHERIRPSFWIDWLLGAC